MIGAEELTDNSSYQKVKSLSDHEARYKSWLIAPLFCRYMYNLTTEPLEEVPCVGSGRSIDPTLKEGQTAHHGGVFVG